MKRALITIATVSILAPTAWVAGANAQANINQNIYPVTPGAQREPWEAGPGPNKRGAMCVTHVDINRGYGYQAPCPAPKAAAAPKAKRRVGYRPLEFWLRRSPVPRSSLTEFRAQHSHVAGSTFAVLKFGRSRTSSSSNHRL
jgi:hypothetical protein